MSALTVQVVNREGALELIDDDGKVIATGRALLSLERVGHVTLVWDWPPGSRAAQSAPWRIPIDFVDALERA